MSPALRNNILPTELPSVFRRSRAHNAGVSDRRLRRLVEDGIVERIGHGVYRRADTQPADMDLLEIAAATPRATLCLGSALARHGLVDLIPPVIDVALPRNVRQPHVAAPVRWHAFSPDTFELGRDTLDVGEGLSLGIYSAERSICDAYRMRHLEGDELGREALRAWLRRPGSQPSTLLRMAESFPKARSALRQDLQVLL
ncbi:MAG: type IV toxin-antitoxin system AbiEi family antitoxin domain-containing protein [Actinomycetota bacterium]|nr:type IV toxin-antitoxin system AbiEi family antitoxin domain-containing protein [Actinomycetota bacterium]